MVMQGGRPLRPVYTLDLAVHKVGCNARVRRNNAGAALFFVPAVGFAPTGPAPVSRPLDKRPADPKSPISP